MPDSEGKLNDAEKDEAIRALSARWPVERRQCPICASAEWTITEHYVQPITLGPGYGLRLGGIGYPQVMLLSPCGYSIFFNAVILGLVPSDAAPAEPENPPAA